MSLLAEIDAGLASSCPEARRRSVQRLRDIDAREALTLLRAALGDEDWRVRKEAVAIASQREPRAEVAAAIVEVLVDGEDVGQRNAAVEVLSMLGKDAIAAIEASLPEMDADGRKLAAEALGGTRDVEALAALEVLCEDADVNVRVAAIDQIAEVCAGCRERGVFLLESALLGDEVQVELAALEGLSRLGANLRWESLESSIQHPMLRATALGLAANGDDPRAAFALAAALDDPRGSLFAVAVSGLSELASERRLPWADLRAMTASLSDGGRARLLAAIDGAEPGPSLIVASLAGLEEALDPALDAFLGEQAAREAEVSLRIFGQAALPRLRARLLFGEGDARAALVPLLVALAPSEGGEAAQTLRSAIADGSEAVAGAALLALATLGEGSDLEIVADLVSSKAARVAAAAEAALASLAARHPETARRLAHGSVGQPERAVALAILLASSPGPTFGTIDDDLSVIEALLAEGDARSRRAALLAIGALGSPLGLELARAALVDASPAVRYAAVSALGQLRTAEGRPVGVGALLDLLRFDDPEIVTASLQALGETGEGSTAEVLAEFTRAPSVAVAVAAITALARVDLDAGLPALLDAARSDEAEVVKSALSALEGSPDPRVASSFERALDHDAWDVRTLAAEGLALVGAAGPLERRLARESMPLVREALERAIAIVLGRAP